MRGKFTEGNLKAYFMKTAKYKVYEIARKAGYMNDSKKSVVENIEDVDGLDIEDSSPEDIRRKELYQKLDQIVSTLPEKCRQLFHLHLNLGKSMKEIAPILGYENDRVAITKNKKCKEKLISVANAANLASYLMDG